MASKKKSPKSAAKKGKSEPKQAPAGEKPDTGDAATNDPAGGDPPGNEGAPGQGQTPTAAQEILDTLSQAHLMREEVRKTFYEQQQAIRKNLQEQRRSALEYITNFHKSLQSQEDNMVAVATRQAKDALDMFLPGAKAAPEAAPDPAPAPDPPPAPDPAAASDPAAAGEAEDSATPDAAEPSNGTEEPSMPSAAEAAAISAGLANDPLILAALKLIIMDVANIKKMAAEDMELAQSVLLNALKKLARQQKDKGPGET